MIPLIIFFSLMITICLIVSFYMYLQDKRKKRADRSKAPTPAQED